jgi:hypothetical protein
MTNLELDILNMLRQIPGLSDRELSVALKGDDKSTPYINQICRRLQNVNMLYREKRQDSLIGNFVSDSIDSASPGVLAVLQKNNAVSEKKIKQALERYLNLSGWTTSVNWSEKSGNDIEAYQGRRCWIIEVKGTVSIGAFELNSFLVVLGEILQRMDNPSSKYSIALPENDSFRRMWERLPLLAKTRTGLSALFVDPLGSVNESFPAAYSL